VQDPHLGGRDRYLGSSLPPRLRCRLQAACYTFSLTMGAQILGGGAPEELAVKPTGLSGVSLPKPLEIFLGVAGAVPVRVKIMGMVLGIVLLLGGSMLMSMRSSLVTELETLSPEQADHVTELVSRAVILATIGTALIGIAAASVLTYLLTQPIKELVRVLDAAGRGNLSQRARVSTRDEIGRLAESFNGMIESLHRSQTDLQHSHAELLRRNHELSTLNAIAAIVNRSPYLRDVLEESVRTVLAAMRLDHGRVYVRDSGDRLSTITSQRSPLSTAIEDTEAWELRERASETLRSGSFGMRSIARRVLLTIPLGAGEQTLGVMAVAGPREHAPSEDDQRLLRAVGNQIGMAIEKAQLWEQLQEKEKVRAGLLQKVISAQEEERKRIARELHDETSQMLTSLAVGLKLLEGTPDQDRMRAHAAELRELAASTIRAVHTLAFELRPSVLDDLGLVAAVGRYCRSLSQRGLEVDFHVAGMDDIRLAPETETAVYRIIQEALTNVVRHSDATEASVVLERRTGSILAIVEDNGRGFNVSQLLDSSMRDRSLGLYGMHERAGLVGATLTIESTPGSGTSVFVETPINAEVASVG
jgi:signal transduction histidine kinase